MTTLYFKVFHKRKLESRFKSATKQQQVIDGKVYTTNENFLYSLLEQVACYESASENFHT